MPLTALQVKNAKPGRHGDGKGLYLLVSPSGCKSWVLRVQANGRRRDFGLGSTDLVSLSEAREKAREGRKMAKNGLDPSLEWKRVYETTPTFESAARRYHDNVKGGWKNGKHANQWISTLETHAFPVIGALPVDQIDAAAIQRVLIPIWLSLPETARRVRQRVGAVLDFSHGHGWRAAEAPMRAVSKGLPRQTKKAKHFAAMPYSDMPQFMSVLRGMDTSFGRLALQFTILTAARSGEVRGATWGEVDMRSAIWVIPGSRMKAGETHSVPLSDEALDVLRQVQELGVPREDKPMFPGLKGKSLSNMTLTKALRSVGGGAYTVHGMRSTFRDWVAERMPFVPGDVAEAALAHTIPNRVEAAYRRAKYLDQRRDLMARWADFLSGRSSAVALAAKG